VDELSLLEVEEMSLVVVLALVLEVEEKSLEEVSESPEV
jgi:hypothetical protein